jgi:hypothetical protein
MRIIITETQFDRVIPTSIIRRLDKIDDDIYEMLYNTSIGAAVVDYDRDDYIYYVMDYVEELLSDEYFFDVTKSGDEYDKLKSLFVNKIGEFWDGRHEEQD